MLNPERLAGKIIWGDCLSVMRKLPDKSISLIITDPPYGLDKRLSSGGGQHKDSKFRLLYCGQEWDKAIGEEYFQEIFRISKNQIIFGGNYYSLPATRGIICWDKQQMMPTFSRWEYAWTSFDMPSRMYELRNGDDSRVHPTQKPVKLFKQILSDLSDESDLILDCFAGSCTTAVACHELNRKWIMVERELRYVGLSRRRLDAVIAQQRIW